MTLRRKAALCSAITLILTMVSAMVLLTPRAEAVSLFSNRAPGWTPDPDTQSVELGVRFSSDVAGLVSGIRFYKTTSNPGPHRGTLWTANGTRLAQATVVRETRSGWQHATFDHPVRIAAHTQYVASYRAPAGHYSSTEHAFDRGYRSGHLQVPVGGGVYSYVDNAFPDQSWHDSNYYVDVNFTPDAVASASPTSKPTSQATSQPTSESDPAGSAALSRVPWEGGPAYYKQFPGSSAFTNPNVFPIGIWWGVFDSDTNVKWDKAHGINFYTQLGGTENGALIAQNDMYLIQGADQKPVRNLPFNDPHWVGWLLSDERDAAYDPPSLGQAEILRQLQQQKQYCATGTDCKFSYANYTGIVTSDYNPAQVKADETFVNLYGGPVSVDGYYYTDPSCDDPDRSDAQVNAPDNAHCRTAAAYGNFIKNLRTRDQADGKLKPLWGFVENGAPGSNGRYITPDQMNGAAWNMVINEARGLVWFNQSFSGSCQSGNVIRSAEADPTGCNAARVAAMKKTDLEIQGFAPVLNTQSYRWTFGSGMDTMLKAYGDSAYIFSMIGLDSDPGRRTFTLPGAITGTSVEVVGENRTIPVVGGKFTDTFAAEYTKHIYKIKI